MTDTWSVSRLVGLLVSCSHGGGIIDERKQWRCN